MVADRDVSYGRYCRACQRAGMPEDNNMLLLDWTNLGYDSRTKIIDQLEIDIYRLVINPDAPDSALDAW